MKAEPEIALDTETWMCESCGTPHYGVNPPDECTLCGREYFDNYADVLKEMGIT